MSEQPGDAGAAEVEAPLCPVCAEPVPAARERCPRCQAGLRLHGRYLLRSLLGRGGQARTFAAHDLERGRAVAVKELSLAHARDWKSVELFRREATVLAGLDHPGVPRLVEYFEEERGGITFFYLVEELCPGESLAAALRRGQRWSEIEARALAAKVLDILEYLHAESPPIVHRDLKPSNILVRPDGGVTLVDFGLVRDVSRPEGGSTMSAGTPGYAPLEQFAGRAVPATDLYALGATLVALLARREPADLLSPRTQRLEYREHVAVGPDLRRVLDRLLEPDPDRRYQTAAEARADLARVTLPIDPALRSVARARSRVLVAVIAALVAVVGGAVTVTVTRLLRARDDQRNFALFAGMPQRYTGTVQSVVGMSALQAGARCAVRVTLGRDRLGRDECRVGVECGSGGRDQGLSFGTRTGECRVTPGPPAPVLTVRARGRSQYIPSVNLSVSRAGGRLALFHEGGRSYRAEIDLDPEQ